MWKAALIGIVAMALTVAVGYFPEWTGGASPNWAGLILHSLFAVGFGFGWPRFLRIPAKKTLGTVLSLTGIFAGVAAFVGPAPSYLLWVMPVAALGIGAIFVVELIRGTGQSHRLESTFGGIVGVIILISAAGWIAVNRYNEHSDMTLITGASAIVVLAVSMINWPERVIAPFGLVLGALAGPLTALAFSDVRILPSAIIGLLVAAVLLAFRKLSVGARDVQSISAGIAVGLAPILAIGTLVYLADRLLLI